MWGIYFLFFLQSIWTNLSSSTVLNGLQSSWCFVGSKVSSTPYTTRKFNNQTPKKTAYWKEEVFSKPSCLVTAWKTSGVFCVGLGGGGWYVTDHLLPEARKAIERWKVPQFDVVSLYRFPDLPGVFLVSARSISYITGLVESCQLSLQNMNIFTQKKFIEM